MDTHSRIVLCAYLPFSLFAFGGCDASKNTQSVAIKDYPALCDAFASDPHDPNRWSREGVEDGAIAVGPAMQYCGKAAELNPTEPRFYFQYGRALQGCGKDSAAREAFGKALKMGYPPAAKSLADYLWDDTSAETESLYRYAIDNGFTPAKDALAEYLAYVKKNRFETGVYSETMDMLYARDFTGLRSDPSTTYLYMDGMYQKLEDQAYLFIDPSCNTAMSSLAVNWGIPLGNLSRLAVSLIEDASRIQYCHEHPFICAAVGFLDYSAKESVVGDQATKDIVGLVNRYGCESEITKTIFRNGLDYLAFEESHAPDSENEARKSSQE